MSNLTVMGRILLGVLLIAALAAPLAAEQPVQIAVLRLEPRQEDPETAWLGAALGQLLASALGRHEGIVAVDRERVVDLVRERDRRARGLIRADEAGRLARIADADWGIVGSYGVKDGGIDVDLTVVDAATGRALRSGRVAGSIYDLGRLVAGLVRAVFGAEGLAPAVPIPPVAVEAFRAYAEALAAEERGDYAEAFVSLSRALREEPAFASAQVELGRLYHRLGEPEHAVVAFRQVVEQAIEVEHVITAALAGADILKHDLRDVAGASRLLQRVVERFPYHESAHLHVGRIAAYRADGGDVTGALSFLAQRIEQLEARRRTVYPPGGPWPSGPTARAKHARLMGRDGALSAAIGTLRNYQRMLAGRFADVLPRDVPLPAGWYRLDALDSVVRLEGASVSGRPPGFPSGHLTILAPRGYRIAAFEVLFVARPVDGGGRGRITWTPWECGASPIPRQHVERVEAGQDTIRAAAKLPVPAPRIALAFHGEHVELDAFELRATLVQDGPHLGPWPPLPSGSVPLLGSAPGAPRHARFVREPEGRIRIVCALGPRAASFPGHGAMADAFGDADLWILTQEKDGLSFAPPRRLRASSIDGEYHPSLLRGRDGRYRLVWVMSRPGTAYGGLWYAESDDLEVWSWPRRVRLPNIPNPRTGPGAYSTGPGPIHAVAHPQLIERRAGLFEVFVTAWHGPEGAGVYHITTADGIAWSEAKRVAPQSAVGSVAPLRDGGLLLAAWTEENLLCLRHIELDGRVQVLASDGLPPLPTRMGWYRPVLGAAPDGVLHLWLPVEPGVWGRYLSTDGHAWRGPVDEIRGARPTDVHIGEDGEVLTLIETCEAVLLRRTEEAE